MAQTFIAEPSDERRASFLTAYARKFLVKKIPVPMAAAQGYDAVYLLVYSLFGIRGGNFRGPAIKAALTQNMLVMGMVKNGAITFAYPEDAKRNLFVQRKQ